METVLITGHGPEVEARLLRELLEQDDDNSLAAVNAYKHRLHAVRGEYATVRLRLQETEEKLSTANSHVAQLELRLAHLEAQLAEMRQSRAWILAEKMSRWLRTLRRFLPR